MARKMVALEVLLENRGLSQQELARAIDVDRSMVSRYINGRSEPTLSGFRAMREALGVTSDALLGALELAARRARRNGRRAAA